MDDMTISQYDLEVLRDSQVARKQKHERAMNRWRYGSAAVGYIALAAVVLYLILTIARGVAGPSAGEQLEHREKERCIATHQTWLKVANGDRGATYGTCIGDNSRG